MPEPSQPQRSARLIPVIRNQSELRVVCLDDILPDDHRARLLWAFTEKLDLTESLSRIRSIEGSAGRPSWDPRVLLALWLYATSQGIGSARRLSQLCESDVGYRWLCGDQAPNHHTLSDFRSLGGNQLDKLMRQLLMGLVSNHILTLRRVSQDGVRVRASAGAGSFRRKSTLLDLESAVKHQIESLKREIDLDPQGSNKREQAAKAKALKEREERVARALKAVDQVQETIDSYHCPERRKREARASTTDPDARVMRMADGGFRPAANIQFATDTETRLVVGVEATNGGSDTGRMDSMLDQVQAQTSIRPEEILVDGGYSSRQDVQAVSEKGTAVIAPLPNHAKVKNPHKPRKGDTLEIAAWRLRMAREEIQETYRQRASTSETVHADMRRHRGLIQLPVRGLDKIQSIALLMALTYNALRVISMGWA